MTFDIGTAIITLMAIMVALGALGVALTLLFWKVLDLWQKN